MGSLALSLNIRVLAEELHNASTASTERHILKFAVFDASNVLVMPRHPNYKPKNMRRNARSPILSETSHVLGNHAW
jgi:hypothetical protein